MEFIKAMFVIYLFCAGLYFVVYIICKILKAIYVAIFKDSNTNIPVKSNKINVNHIKTLQTTSEFLDREYYKNTPKEITSMDWREFEIFISNIFREKGYKTTLTPAEKDGGKDVIAEKDGITYFIECKHWQYDGIIGRELLQKLVGAAVASGVNHVIFVATCQYNSNAREYAEQVNKNNFNIKLWGLNDILDFCPTYPSIFIYNETNDENFYIRKPVATPQYNKACTNINNDIDSFINKSKQIIKSSSWSLYSFVSETVFENIYIVSIQVTNHIIIKNGNNFPEQKRIFTLEYDKKTGIRKSYEIVSDIGDKLLLL